MLSVVAKFETNLRRKRQHKGIAEGTRPVSMTVAPIDRRNHKSLEHWRRDAETLGIDRASVCRGREIGL
jgi:DNA invertase Pin-like site-specific DNA recombinase